MDNQVMEVTGTIYITIGLLYGLGGALFFGLAIATFWSEQNAFIRHDNIAVDANDFVIQTRCFADSLMGVLMLFTGFALQALGHNVTHANSFITFMLITTLFFILLVHSVYIREVMVEDCAADKANKIKQTMKNQAYFGQP